MERLQVQLFNGLTVSYEGIPIHSFNTPRLQALFSFLILNRGTPQFRYYIANHFWPDSPEAQARTNLRKLLHLFRQAFPNIDDFISLDAQSITWRVDAPCDLDVESFESALAAAEKQELSLEQIEKAVALYRGDLLPSCYDEWIIPLRELLRQNYLMALRRGAAIHEERRDYATALDYQRRLIQYDPLDEIAHTAIIRLNILMGDRVAAMNAYQRFADELTAELGVEPGSELQSLYWSLQKNALVEPRPDKAALTELPLVGRKNEWQALQACWKRAVSGSPHLLLITGEAGIGKTRLAEEMVHWASRQGICTAVARAYPAEGNLPYAPVITWLRANPLPELEDIWLSEISRLLPEVLKRHPHIIPVGVIAEAWQRQRLFEALARAVLGDCQKRMLLLDDMQWADRDTLEWLHYLIRHDANARLLIIGTVRSEEIADSTHPLISLRAALGQLGAVSEISLGPLNEGETRQLAAEVAGKTLPANEMSTLYHETEGSPLFVVETVRAGIRMNEVLPGKIQVVLTTRITQLTPETRELVSIAATIGRQFSLPVLQQASGVSDAALAHAMDELLGRRIVREFVNPAGEISYDFSHDKLREAAFMGLSTAHRRLLHRQVGNAIRDLAQEMIEDYAAEIASHYDRAGLAAQAIEYYRLAGERARKIFANEDAIRYYKRLLELIQGMGSRQLNTAYSAETQIDLLKNYGDVLELAGQFAEAQSVFQSALEKGTQRPSLWRSATLRRLSDVQVSLYDHPAALKTLNLAEQILEQELDVSDLENQAISPTIREWIEVQYAKVRWMYWEGQLAGMDTIIKRVRPIVECCGDDELVYDLLGLRYQAELRRENYRLSEQTIDLARQKCDLNFPGKTAIAASYAEFQYGFALLWGGRPREAKNQFEAALSKAERQGAMTALARILTYLGVTHRYLGNADELARIIDQETLIAKKIGEHVYEGAAYANQAWLDLRMGRMDEAYRQANKALKIWAVYPYMFMSLACWPLLEISVRRGKLDEAQDYASKLLDPEQRPLTIKCHWALTCAVEALKTGAPVAAKAYFHQAIRIAQNSSEF